MISPTVEDYLKAIYKLRKGKESVSTSAIAERLELSNATVTAMVKKLAEKKFLKHVSYHGVVLTGKGEKTALDVIRRHRLVELFLKEVLGLPWDKVHAEAEKLEHVMSDELLDRIDFILGYPKTDPHGGHSYNPKNGSGKSIVETFEDSVFLLIGHGDEKFNLFIEPSSVSKEKKQRKDHYTEVNEKVSEIPNNFLNLIKKKAA
ncbi:MAG TPA: metal-dependent transcriptional regulator [Thermodesulfobacteriota bacterium]|nr:metal-dependent transcriptional regulator [Thermodesulfobacteriota bacterium]